MTIVNTIIISDLHLGSEVTLAGDIPKILENYEFKRLILLGDIFDDLNFKRLKKTHWKVLSYLRKISDEKEVVWILGNHDILLKDLSYLLGVTIHEEYQWENKGINFLALHGHIFDMFMKNNILISDIASWVYLVLQKLDKKTHRFSRWIKKLSKSWLRLSEQVANKAINYCEKKECNIVFCGHTHQVMTKTENNISYYNTGCWTDIPCSFITIDDNNKIKTILV